VGAGSAQAQLDGNGNLLDTPTAHHYKQHHNRHSQQKAAQAYGLSDGISVGAMSTPRGPGRNTPGHRYGDELHRQQQLQEDESSEVLHLQQEVGK
jgi:hypothetical protein